jgi:hypothetical protein
LVALERDQQAIARLAGGNRLHIALERDQRAIAAERRLWFFSERESCRFYAA